MFIVQVILILFDLDFRAYVWLTYRLAGTFALGLPLVILIWASIRKVSSIKRLLLIYWKNASLLGISLLLIVDNRPLAYFTGFLASILMVASVWFWVDLNEELMDLPPWKALPLTTKIWRWSLSGFGLMASAMTLISLSCINNSSTNRCLIWLEFPTEFHQITSNLLKFILGATWTESLSAFVGYACLIAYSAGLLQWLLIKLPRQGRIAGDF